MLLPGSLRGRVPAWLRDRPEVRAVALASGLIPPRSMHSAAEAELLTRCATGARRVVEIGVYEGSSARVLCAALARNADLHLIDPFNDPAGTSMLPGWRGTPFATRMAIRRFAADGGPRIQWHVARSQDVGRSWTGPALDLVFVDGDHGEAGVREDWQLWHPHVKPGGVLAFHDARLGQPGGRGAPGPTQVVNELRTAAPATWAIESEVDTLVVMRKSPGPAQGLDPGAADCHTR